MKRGCEVHLLHLRTTSIHSGSEPQRFIWLLILQADGRPLAQTGRQKQNHCWTNGVQNHLKSATNTRNQQHLRVPVS